LIIKNKLSDFNGGWFIGDFDLSLFKTKDFEVSVKIHPKGEVWDKHYHKVATEYNYVVSGTVIIDGESYTSGDLFTVQPGTVVDPDFAENCTIVCVKVPSLIGDKYVCE
jgi:quercetin dioxygenase-like cupin family protein